jgi:hypothetical protein
MIYNDSDEITVLFHADNITVTLHRNHHSTVKNTMTRESYERWWRLAEMFTESETNESLTKVLEQAEIIYGLSRNS